MPTKVLRYGLLAPTEGTDLVWSQLRLAHKYRNKLVEIDIVRRDAVTKANSDAEQEAAQEAANEARKAARAASGVYWGTYLQVEEFVKKACANTPPHKNPRFLRWTGEGLLAVQVQKGKSSKGLFQIHDGFDNRKGRRAGQRKELWLRVGAEKTKPVWAKFPLILHRPIEGEVTWIKVTVRREGTRTPVRTSGSSHFLSQCAGVV